MMDDCAYDYGHQFNDYNTNFDKNDDYSDHHYNNTTAKKVCKRLYSIVVQSFLLAHDIGREMDATDQQGLLGYFYDKVLDENALARCNLDQETLSGQIITTLESESAALIESSDEIEEGEIMVSVPAPTSADIIEMGNNKAPHPTEARSSSATTVQKDATKDLWKEFFQMCWLFKDGLMLENRFKESADGLDTKILNLSVKFEHILFLLKQRRETIPSELMLEIKNLEHQGYLPFSPSLKRNESPVNSNAGKRGSGLYEEELQPRKRGRRGAKGATSHSGTSSNYDEDGTHIRDKIPKKYTKKEEKVWWDHFDKLIQYHEEKGTYNVPETEIFIDDDGESYELGKWLKEQREALSHLMLWQTDRYDVLSDCMCNGLWLEDDTAENTSKNNGQPSLYPQPTSTVDSPPSPLPSSSKHTPTSSSSKPSLSNSSSAGIPKATSSFASPKPSETIKKSDTVSNQAVNSSSSAKPMREAMIVPKAVTGLSRKSTGTNRSKTIALPSVPIAEPKENLFLPKRQDKLGDTRKDSLPNSQSSSAPSEPKSIGDHYDDSDSEVAIFVKKRNSGSEKPKATEAYNCAFYWKNRAEKIARFGLVLPQSDQSKLEYQVKYIKPKQRHRNLDSEFLPDTEIDTVRITDIEFGNIFISKATNLIEESSKEKLQEYLENKKIHYTLG